MPVYYECQRCTACCRWPGQVRVSETEIDAMAALLAMATGNFVEEFTELNPQRSGLVLKNKPNHECIFLDDGNCRVQAAKPRQCVEFPNLWQFPGFEQVCQALPREVSPSEFDRLTGLDSSHPSQSTEIRLTPSPLAPPESPAKQKLNESLTCEEEREP